MNNKEKLYKFIAIASVILLIVNTVYCAKLMDRIDDLSSRVSSDYHGLRNDIYSISNDMSSLKGDIRHELEAQSSLFTDVQCSFAYADGKLTVNVSVMPKEITPGSRVYVAWEDEKAEAKENNGKFTASLEVEPAEAIAPVVTIESLLGTRQQEQLDDIYPMDEMTIEVQAEWAEQIGMASGLYDELEQDLAGRLAVMVYDHNGVLSNGIKSAELIVNSSHGSDTELIERIPLEQMEIPRVLKYNGPFMYDGVFMMGDLSEHMAKKDGKTYTVDIEIESADGLKYTIESMADFWIGEDSSSMGIGGIGVMEPVF